MKLKSRYILAIILAFVGITYALKAQQQAPPEPKVTVEFTVTELNQVYSMVDNSNSYGEVRKPILQKLEAAYRLAMTPAKSDTTKPKKN